MDNNSVVRHPPSALIGGSGARKVPEDATSRWSMGMWWRSTYLRCDTTSRHLELAQRRRHGTAAAVAPPISYVP